MGSNRRNLKAFVRYDGSGRVIPGGPILSAKKPKVGNWKEINAYQCCNPAPQPTGALRLTFDSIENANLLVGDASSVGDWNTFFDLPTYGSPFTSVEVVGNEVRLFGGSNIKVKPALMYNQQNAGLISIDDQVGCITSVGGDAFSYNYDLITVSLPACTIIYGPEDSPQNDYGSFGGCDNLSSLNLPLLQTAGDWSFANASFTTISFPQLTSAGNNCFYYCSLLTTISLPLLTTAGDGGFLGCSLLTTISLPQLTSLGNDCFINCNTLTTVNFPNLLNGGDFAFYGCSLLSNITMPKLINAGTNFFNRCENLVNISLPDLTSIGLQGLLLCTSLETIYFPSCTDLGGTVGDDYMFDGITGNNITLTVPIALTTCNSGNPDGDIQYLQANNTVTIITV